MINDRIQAIYDKRAATYDRSVGFGEKIAVGDFRAKFGAALRGQTLEIAVGSGLNLPYYTSAVTTSIGIDFSAGMLAVARERANTLGLDIDLRQMDAQALDFPDSSFDTVAISLALCTIPDPTAALREMVRVCRTDGQIVLLEHVLSPNWPVALLERLVSPLQERLIGCHLNRDTIELVRREGLRIQSEERRLAGVFRLVIAHPPAL